MPYTARSAIRSSLASSWPWRGGPAARRRRKLPERWDGRRPRFGEIERGQRKSITHLELSCFASVVGLRYSGRLFLGTTRLRDATQLEMIGGYRALAAGCGWNVRIEDPIPITGDLRAFDLMLRRAAARVAHEFISRLYDVQAQIRPLLQKQRDAGGGTLILVKDNAENQRLVREAGGALRDLFPLSSRDILQAIREGRDPGSNGIVFWRSRLLARV